MKFNIVPDQACPVCGAYWGHPDQALNFPNRIKVDNDWRCYNPLCSCAYYRDGKVIENKLPPEEFKKMADEIQKDIQEAMKGKRWEMTKVVDGITTFHLVDDD